MKTNQLFLFIFTLFLFCTACKKPEEKEYVAPIVSTHQPREVTDKGAVLIASFTKGSENFVEVGFEWKKLKESEWRTVSGTLLDKRFEAVITDLEKDVEYSTKAFVVDSTNKEYFGKEISFRTHGTVTDVDGNVYFSKRYGGKQWTIENLRVTHYADGTPIEVCNTAVNSDSDGPLCYSDYYHSQNLRNPNFGLLYNWAAAARADSCNYVSISLNLYTQGVCPDGWHLPSTREWNELLFLYGGSEVASTHMRTSNWPKISEFFFTNDTEFSIEPAGYFYNEFLGVFTQANFWTSSGEIEKAFAVRTGYLQPRFYVGPPPVRKCFGYSVRCVRY